jgi:hypothetical protein
MYIRILAGVVLQYSAHSASVGILPNSCSNCGVHILNFAIISTAWDGNRINRSLQLTYREILCRIHQYT